MMGSNPLVNLTCWGLASQILLNLTIPPRRLITDKLASYAAGRRQVMPTVIHTTQKYANNRAEVSHQPTRQRERQMR